MARWYAPPPPPVHALFAAFGEWSTVLCPWGGGAGWMVDLRAHSMSIVHALCCSLHPPCMDHPSLCVGCESVHTAMVATATDWRC